MCGILGVYGPGKNQVEKHKFEHALSLMHHRGPDGSRVWSGRKILLGHARLSIVDLSEEAAQPMADRTSRYRIIHNGEIFNYQEIRQELEKEGIVFQTRSDTEVILEAYKRWGIDCQARFNGMWAFAIYDTLEEALFISRDRYGIKPLYHATLAGNMVFASEMKPLLDLGVGSQPDWSEVNCFLQEWSSGVGGNTLFKNIHQLPAGHCMLVSLSGTKQLQWWVLEDHLLEPPRNFHERIEQFRELFEDSVRLRMRNDVDTGVTLSGGIDSSSVYGAARKLSNLELLRLATSDHAKNFRTFSFSSLGSALDETPWVKECIRYWNDESRTLILRPALDEMPDLIDNLLWYQEVPVWTSGILVYHLLYRQVASLGTRVILEGHGGDELFSGYREDVRLAVQTFAERGQLRYAWRASHCLQDMTNLAFEERPLQAWRILLQALPIVRQRGYAKHQSGAYAGMRPARSLLSHRMKYFSPLITEAEPVIHPRIVKGFSAHTQSLYVQFTQKFLPTMLQVFDRAAMTYSIESRFPFMDHRIVQFAFSLPEQDKVAYRTKEIVRRAGESWLPENVRNRKVKTGFNTNERDWFESPVTISYLRDVFNSKEALQSELFNGRMVADDLDRFCREGFTRRDSTRVWRVLNIHLWNRKLVIPFST